MDPNTKRYNDFVHAYKKACPDLKKTVQLEKAQKLWNDVKNDLTKFEETLADLQKKTYCRESNQLSFWSNTKPKTTKEPSKQPETLVETPPSSPKSGSQSLTNAFVESISFSYSHW